MGILVSLILLAALLAGASALYVITFTTVVNNPLVSAIEV
jgi:hypothetical protein